MNYILSIPNIQKKYYCEEKLINIFSVFIQFLLLTLFLHVNSHISLEPVSMPDGWSSEGARSVSDPWHPLPNPKVHSQLPQVDFPNFLSG